MIIYTLMLGYIFRKYSKVLQFAITSAIMAVIGWNIFLTTKHLLKPILFDESKPFTQEKTEIPNS